MLHKLSFILLATYSLHLAAADWSQKAFELIKIDSDEMLDKFPLENKYRYLDPLHEISPRLLHRALAALESELSFIPNQNYLSIIDFSLPSNKKRFFLIDLKTGKVHKMLVSHGKGSDPQKTGKASKFSNLNNSLMSSLGFYLTGETYIGKHGFSLKLDGLSETNFNARERGIVIHAAPYVADNLNVLGRSWGCPAVNPSELNPLVEKIKEGSLLYIGLSN